MHSPDHDRARRWTRAGLVALAANQAIPGVWAALWPRSFYDDFPLPGRAWIHALGPFSEHLLRDVGMLSVSTAVVLGVAATVMEPRLVTIALASVLCFSVPHALWHMGHMAAFGLGDQIAQVALNAIPVAIGLACLRWSWKRTARAHAGRTTAGE